MFIYSIETVIAGIFIAIFIVIKCYCALSHWIKYRKCQHDEVTQTMACDAICRKCRKNLGFIGVWRKANELKKVEK